MKPHFFNLIIRDNLTQTQDDFSPGDIRSFDQDSISCGTDPTCGCRVDSAPEAPPRAWFRIERMAQSNRWHVIPTIDDESNVFVNLEKEPLTSSRELISGDALRVGHVTFRFQRARGTMAPKRKKDYISIFAKVSLILIFALELGLVFWLPHKLQNSKLMVRSVMSQRVMQRIDGLRKRSRQAPETATKSALPSLTKTLVAQEVDSLSQYVREQQNHLTTEQWRDIHANLSYLDTLLNHADTGQLGAPLPAFNDQAAITALLKKYHHD